MLSFDCSLLDHCVVPEIAPQIFAKPTTSTSIHIDWYLPINNNIPCLWNGAITKHLITYEPLGGISASNISIETENSVVELNYTITGLEIFTEYVIKVSVGTEIGYSELFAERTIRTLNDSKLVLTAC